MIIKHSQVSYASYLSFFFHIPDVVHWRPPRMMTELVPSCQNTYVVRNKRTKNSCPSIRLMYPSQWIYKILYNCYYEYIRYYITATTWPNMCSFQFVYKMHCPATYNKIWGQDGDLHLTLTLVMMNISWCFLLGNITRCSENDNTPQPIDQRMDSLLLGLQVGNCNSLHQPIFGSKV